MDFIVIGCIKILQSPVIKFHYAYGTLVFIVILPNKTMHSSIKPLLVAALLIVSISPAMIYIPGVPVNSMTLYQLQVAANMLQNRLHNNPNLPSYMKYQFYSDVYLTNYFLQKVANDPGISAYNNVIYGQQNQVDKGNKNIIFGNGNSVAGSNNYVFSQNFDHLKSGSSDSNLVLDDWLVQLLKMYLIPFDPHYAIKNWQKSL